MLEKQVREESWRRAGQPWRGARELQCKAAEAKPHRSCEVQRGGSPLWRYSPRLAKSGHYQEHAKSGQTYQGLRRAAD